MSKRGVRFGAEIRKRADKVDDIRRSAFACPRCGKKKVKRSGNARFTCKSCGGMFAGGAYSLSTPAGDVSSRLAEEYRKR